MNRTRVHTHASIVSDAATEEGPYVTRSHTTPNGRMHFTYLSGSFAYPVGPLEHIRLQRTTTYDSKCDKTVADTD